MFVLTFDAASPNISDLSTLSFRSDFYIFVVPLKGSFSRDQLAQFPVAGIYVKAIGDLLSLVSNSSVQNSHQQQVQWSVSLDWSHFRVFYH